MPAIRRILVACALLCRLVGCYDSRGDLDADAEVGVTDADALDDGAAVDDATAEDDELRDDADILDEGSCIDCWPSCPTELGGRCNVVEQCGCGEYERCIIDLEGAVPVEICVPAGYDAPMACPSEGDDCPRGMQCLGIDGTHRYCMEFCYTDDDCPPDRTCDFETPWGRYRLCGDAPSSCDPFTGDGCDTGEGCTISPPGGSTSCTPAGTGSPGDECGAAGCVVGAGCYSVDSGATFQCFAYCDLADTSHPCPDGVTCQAVLGHPTIGVCLAM